DVPNNIELMTAYLASEPYRLLTAASGQECLDILEREEVHLVLLDVMMPVMGGYDVLVKIREDPRWRTMPVILVTALNKREERIRGIELGADEFLSKPVDKNEVLARVRTQMRLTFLRRQLSEKEKIVKIIGEVQEGIVIMGREFAPVVVNRRAADLLAMEQPPSDVIAHIRKTFPPSFGAADPPAEFLLERPATARHKPLHLRCTLHTVRDLRGEIESHLLFVRDITEQYLEDSLRQDFLSLISHKLMTPLTGIEGHFRILSSLLQGTEAAAELQKIVAQEVKLSDLMQRLLFFVQTAPEDLGRMSGSDAIDDLLREITSRYAEKQVVIRKTFTTEGIPRFRELILRELIDNACKFHDKDRLELAVEVGSHRLVVADNGPGIPPEEREKILEAFYQIEKEFAGNVPGVGLGLALVKRLAERQGGKIEIGGALGAGTTVQVTFP
ncbi:MAG: hybrid sensor histidine kinase/response regulator, partial [Candidatus Methylomirabilia bacterium]